MLAQSHGGAADEGSAGHGADGPELEGPRKVAVLLLSMGKPQASRLLKHFDDREIALIARSAAALGSIDKATVDGLIEDFIGSVTSGSTLEGGVKKAEQLLTGVVPSERIQAIMADVTGIPLKPVWQRLVELQPAALAALLTREHPQVAAFVLTQAPPAVAAAAMALLGKEIRYDVTSRMLSIKPVPDAPRKMLEAALSEDLEAGKAMQAGPAIHNRVATIINKLERVEMDEVMAALNERRPADARRVQGLLFTFEDIAKLSPEARVKLFDSVPVEQVILVLKGADATMRDLILSSVAARSRRMMEQEIADGTKVSQKDVLKARRVIADQVLMMAERGDIEIAGQDDQGERAP